MNEAEKLLEVLKRQQHLDRRTIETLKLVIVVQFALIVALVVAVAT